MDHQLEFRVFGSLEIVADGTPIKIDAPKQRAVLAVLLVHVNEVVSTDRLMDAVWGEDEVGVGTLRYHVSKLRETLQSEIGSAAETVIATEAPGYVLRTDSDSLDAARFDGLVDEARQILQSEPERALRLLDEALALWRGDAYAEFAYEEFAHLEVERLAEKRRGAIEDRMDALLALGRHTDAIAQLEGLTARQPHRERLWGQFALALYRGGRQSDAVAALQQIRDSLGELGLDLSPPLKELEQRVFDQDPSLIEDAGRPEQLRGYVLRGVIGEGAHAVVFRAAQPGIGREVALKAIRPELANQPEFVRRFEAEAQLVASLEHPNIVSLYDFWRDPEGAYLVMPYLRGGSLAGVLSQGPLDPPQVLEIVAGIGSALGHAHRRGVVHRDVTPHNVLLDEDGHPYLADFGMASLLGGTGPAVTSSPAYLSPEESAGDKAVIQSDVYSLGVLVHAALADRIPATGEPLPAMSDLRHDLPPAVDDVIACATAPDVADRYASIAAFVDALARAVGIGRDEVPVLQIEERNPYKGLRAFEETDAADFFGREMLVSEVVQTVARHRLVGVVGPSGCGKSSLVKAGVIPVLRRGVLPGSEQWLITEMYPGARPLAELEAALTQVAVARPPGLGEALSGGGTGLVDALDALLPRNAELLLVVDQFEELFALTNSDEERARFLAVLEELVANPSLRVRVLMTMRADFYDRPLEYPEFGEMLRSGLVSVTMPAAEYLREAIAGPARRVGLGVDDALVESIVRDVSGQPGGLPLMEYALTELFERRHGPRLTIEAYRVTAGVMGALGRRAEELFKRYDETGREAVRQTFLRLVTVEEGSADTRRRIPLSELRGLEIDSAALEQVLDDYGSHRLLTFDRDPDTREPTVEVAHEALLARWDRLRTWIDDRRDDLSTYRRLAAAAKEWTDSDGADEYVLTGGRLEHYQAFAAETDLFLTANEAEYLLASRAHNAGLRTRRRRRRRAIMAGFGVAAMIATVFAVVAFLSQQRAEDAAAEALASEELAQQRKEEADSNAANAREQELIAESEARRSRASELAAYAAQVLDEDPNLSLHLLLESIDTAEPTAEIIAALRGAMLKHRAIARLPEPYAEHDGVLSPHGEIVISFTEANYAAIEVPTGRILWEKPQLPEEWIGDGIFAVNGEAVFGLPRISDEQDWEVEPEEPAGLVRIDVTTGERTFYPIASEYGISDILANGSGTIDPNLPIMVRSLDEPMAAVLQLDLEAGVAEPVATYGWGAISDGVWTTDAAVTKVALGLSEQTAVLDLETRETRRFGPKSTYGANQVLSPDGTYVVTTSSNRNDVWNVVLDEPYWTVPQVGQGAAMFDPNGERVLIDNRIYSRDGQLLIELPGEGASSPMTTDGRLILYRDGLFNAGPQGEIASIDLPMGGRYFAGVDLEGDTGVALNVLGSWFGAAYVYDFAASEEAVWGEIRLRIPNVAGDPAISDDGRLVALQQEVEPGWFGPIGLYDTRSGELVMELPGLCSASNDTSTGPDCLAYPKVPFAGAPHHTLLAPDGSFLAATLEVDSPGRALVVWDLEDGGIAYAGDKQFWVAEPVLSPEGDRLLFLETVEGVGEEDRGAQLVVLDTATWEEIVKIPWGEGEEVNVSAEVLRYGPDGSVLRWGLAGLALLEDVTWDVIRRGEEPDCFLRDPQFSPDGSTIASTCWYSGEIILYDAATLTITSQISTGDPHLRGIKFVGDTELLVIGHSGPGIILETDTEKLIEIAKKRVVGDFREDECERYGIERCMPDEEEEPEN